MEVLRNRSYCQVHECSKYRDLTINIGAPLNVYFARDICCAGVLLVYCWRAGMVDSSGACLKEQHPS